MATALQKQDFDKRRAALRERLCDPGFLTNKGLGNEAGIFIFCYDPTLENEVRQYFSRLKSDSQLGMLGSGDIRANIIEMNLYDVFIGICECEDILEAAVEMEQEDGCDELLDTLKSIASADEFVSQMCYEPHNPGDVVLITGVGEVYPFMRVHNILNGMQSKFSDVPIVVAYPGTYDGGSLSLFGKLKDGNYYRAFDLV